MYLGLINKSFRQLELVVQNTHVRMYKQTGFYAPVTSTKTHTLAYGYCTQLTNRRERERDRLIDRDRERQTGRQRQRETDWSRETERDRLIERQRETG